MAVGTDTWADYGPHPGNGVVAGDTDRYSVAKTQRSYDPTGLAAVCGSKVFSRTQGMRQAYPGVEMGTDRLESTTGACV